MAKNVKKGQELAKTEKESTEIQNRKEHARNQLNRITGTLKNNDYADLKAVLPRHITPERMIRLLITTIKRDERLARACIENPESAIAAIMTASQLGLEIDHILGHAYLVPFYNRNIKKHEVQLIPGYKGLVDLVWRSKTVKKVQARCVFSSDYFDWGYGINEFIKHTPDTEGKGKETDPGNITHVYAFVILESGEAQFEVLTRAQIEKVRLSTKSPDRGPWVTHWPQMAMKTAVKKVLNLIPRSTERPEAENLQRALTYDDLIEAGISSDLYGKHTNMPTLDVEQMDFIDHNGDEESQTE
jgi:recombination protein RecT